LRYSTASEEITTTGIRLARDVSGSQWLRHLRPLAALHLIQQAPEEINMAAKLLLIEDDVASCEMLRLILTKEGFQVAVAHDATYGLQEAYALNPDVVILDVMLPDRDGWQVCRYLRETSDVPIMMLTALSSQEDLVKGLDLGADDYIIKPVTPDELVARIRALLRRASERNRTEANQRQSVFMYDNVVIHFDKREVIVDSKPVHLTPTEFHLLSVLVQHRGQVVSHESLLTQIWGRRHVNNLSILQSYVSCLRRKLEKDPSKPSLLRTEWDVGYRFG
jgi:DNA-binding response OmpR family regulator